MAFVAALPEIAEGAEAAGAAAGAGGESGGGMLSKVASLFGSKPSPQPGDENKQQNEGESRTFNFQDAANTARNAIRPDAGGMD